MKSIKNELVVNSLSKYLKKRQYLDSEQKSFNSIKDLTLFYMAHTNSSFPNLISSALIEQIPIDKQYESFLEFVTNAKDPFKSQLTYFLFPLFVHTCLDLVNDQDSNIVTEFYKKHKEIFTSALYQDTLKDIEIFLEEKTLDRAKFVAFCKLKESKYLVKITRDCQKYLFEFFFKYHSLFNIFNLYIELDVVENYDDPTPFAFIDAENLPLVKAEKKIINSSTALQALKEASSKIRAGPLCLPSICLYSIHSSSKGVCCAALSQDSCCLAAGMDDSTIQIWSLTSQSLPTPNLSEENKVKSEFYDYNFEVESSPHSNTKILRDHSGPVYGVKFVPQSDIILSCSEDTTVRAWRKGEAKSAALYIGHNYPIWDLDVNPLGTYFVTASKDYTSRLWSLERTEPLRVMVGHTTDIDSVKFHPNSNYIVTGAMDGTIRFWSIQDGKNLRLFTGHKSGVYALAISPCGKLLASAGEDRKVKLWDISSSSIIKDLKGHSDAIYSLTFNSTGTILASVSSDQSIRLWDVQREKSPSTMQESSISPEQLACYPTKYSLDLVSVNHHNLMIAVGHSINTHSGSDISG